MKTGHRLAPHLYSLSKLIWRLAHYDGSKLISRLAHPVFTVPPQASSPSLVLEQTDMKTSHPVSTVPQQSSSPSLVLEQTDIKTGPPIFYGSATLAFSFLPWLSWLMDRQIDIPLLLLLSADWCLVTLAACRLSCIPPHSPPPPHGVIHKTSLLTSPLSTHPWPFWIPS